ncbi:hypothetical protein GC197_12480 [bacterium]|nr:hypothetical protein [bacterium]
MAARMVVACFLLAGMSLVASAAQPVKSDPTETASMNDDSVEVTVTGTLRTHLLAIGGETTGTTITANGITWELDLSKKPEFRKLADKLDGKKVIVEGSLRREMGIEVGERWIVTVTGLKGA